MRTAEEQKYVERLTLRLVAAWEVMGYGYSPEEALDILGWTEENPDTYKAVMMLKESDRWDDHAFERIIRTVLKS